MFPYACFPYSFHLQERFPLALPKCSNGLASSVPVLSLVDSSAKRRAGEESLGKAAGNFTEVTSEESWTDTQPEHFMTAADTSREPKAVNVCYRYVSKMLCL